MTKDIVPRLDDIIKEFPFENYGLVGLKKPTSIHQYKTWIDSNYHGDMEYLERHIKEKEEPQKLVPQAQSAIVISRSYLPHPKPNPEDFPIQNLKVARYAQGSDYHFWFQQELKDLCLKLKNEFKDHEFLSFSDSSPILERDLAHQAGLGWVGKNSCLIHSDTGSFFFIGEIYTSLKIDHSPLPHPDRCGKCTKCIDACPTDALTENRTMDARRCISFMNIESKELPTQKTVNDLNEWFFGCDICQQICPWNKKHHTPESLNDPAIDKLKAQKEIHWVLTTSNKKLQKIFAENPLSRARGWGLKRNALILAYQYRLMDLKPFVKEFVEHEKLGPLSQWILDQWSTP